MKKDNSKKEEIFPNHIAVMYGEAAKNLQQARIPDFGKYVGLNEHGFPIIYFEREDIKVHLTVLEHTKYEPKTTEKEALKAELKDNYFDTIKIYSFSARYALLKKWCELKLRIIYRDQEANLEHLYSAFDLEDSRIPESNEFYKVEPQKDLQEIIDTAVSILKNADTSYFRFI